MTEGIVEGRFQRRQQRDTSEKATEDIRRGYFDFHLSLVKMVLHSVGYSFLVSHAQIKGIIIDYLP